MGKLFAAAALLAGLVSTAGEAAAQPWNCSGYYGGVYGLQNRNACDRSQAADPYGDRARRLQERIRAADQGARMTPTAPRPPATYRTLDGGPADFQLR